MSSRSVRRRQVLARDGRCRLCGAQHALTVHHIRPRAIGGANARCNLACVCEPCHLRLNRAGELVSGAVVWCLSVLLLALSRGRADG